MGDNFEIDYGHEDYDDSYSAEDYEMLGNYDELDYDQRQRVLRIFDDEILERYCIIPEGWSNWGGDPDTDPDAWDMPDSWYGE